MFSVKVEITKFTNDWQPGWVECEFVDAFGKLQVFNDKVPMFTSEYLDKNSIYPQDGCIACEIVEREIFDGREIVRVNTELPRHLESIDGKTIFEVSAEQIIEFDIV